MKDLAAWKRLLAVGAVVSVGTSVLAQRSSHAYRLVRWRIPAGESGRGRTPGLRILHLSDTHFYRGREDLVAWLRLLARRAGRDFDFVVLTGDMLATRFGETSLASRALQPLIESGVPGAYVFGAHDYCPNRVGNPFKYLQHKWGSPCHDRGGVESDSRRESIGESGGEGAAGIGQDARDGVRCDALGSATRESGAEGMEVPEGRWGSHACPGRVSRCDKKYGAGVEADFGREFRDFLADSPWVNANNRYAMMNVGGWRIQLAGVNDPHVGLDNFLGFGAASAGTVDPPGADRKPGGEADTEREKIRQLRIGLAHAPYARVLNAFNEADSDLVFCGHTHGGQVCWPGGRAVVTNCDLPAGFASGVFSWADSAPLRGFKPGAMRVSVSPGLGTSPFSPWRVFCPPSAFLVELV